MKKNILIIAICIFFIPVSSLSRSGSRLDSVNCGKGMSRLDAKKCAEIEMMKSKMKKESQNNNQFLRGLPDMKDAKN